MKVYENPLPTGRYVLADDYDKVVLKNEQLTAALNEAVSAGEYVVKLCEADVEAGRSPSPFKKSDPNAVMAHCYAAMSFLPNAYKALEGTLVVKPKTKKGVAG